MNLSYTKHLFKTLGALLLLCATTLATAADEELLKPFVLASNAPGDLASVTADTRAKLTGAGFEIVGEYSPYAKTHIIVVTNGALKKHAAQTKMGGFGAIQRVSVSDVNGNIQVAFTNPRYMANVYRMKGDMADIDQALRTALGSMQDFGAKGLTAKKLRKYHYKMFMPYFDEPYELGSFDSQDAALAAVEKGLAAGYGGVSKVYRVDIPGRQASVIGVHMTKGCSGDEYIMSRIDFKDIKSAPHLPYEMLVEDGKVVALHAKFRIALSFPDLSMVGSNSFFSIMCAPDAIEKALASVVKGKDLTEDEE